MIAAVRTTSMSILGYFKIYQTICTRLLVGSFKQYYYEVYTQANYQKIFVVHRMRFKRISENGRRARFSR